MKHRLILGLLCGLLSSAGALSGGGSHDPDVPRLKASRKAKIEKALQRAAHHLDQAVDEVETPIDASLLESETLRLVKDFENEVDKFSDSDSKEQEHPEPRRKLKTDETDALTEVPFVIQPTDADPVLNDESPLVTPTVEYEEKRFDMDLTRKPKVPIVVDEAETKVPEVTKEDVQTVASTVAAQETRSSAPPVVAVTTGDVSSLAPTVVATSGGISTAVPTVAEVVSSAAPAFEVTQGEASTAVPTVAPTAAPTIATTAAPIVFENIASGVVVTYVPTALPAPLSRLGPDVEEDLEPTQDEETQDFKFRNDIFDDMDGVEDGQEEHDQKERPDPHPARLAPRDQWQVDELFDGKTPPPPTLDYMWRPTESPDVPIDPKSFDNIHWRHPVPTKFPQPILGPGACNHIHCPKVEPTEAWVDEKLRNNIPDDEDVDVGINPLPDRHPKGGNAHGIEGMIEGLGTAERAEKLSHKDNDERDGFWMWVQGGTLKNKNHGHKDHVKKSGDHFRMKLLDISAEINSSGEEEPKLEILAKLLDEISAEQ
ncbi:unnamed protein product, partial [Mesorhabditis spiculigera]